MNELLIHFLPRREEIIHELCRHPTEGRIEEALAFFLQGLMGLLKKIPLFKVHADEILPAIELVLATYQSYANDSKINMLKLNLVEHLLLQEDCMSLEMAVNLLAIDLNGINIDYYGSLVGSTLIKLMALNYPEEVPTSLKLIAIANGLAENFFPNCEKLSFAQFYLSLKAEEHFIRANRFLLAFMETVALV